MRHHDPGSPMCVSMCVCVRAATKTAGARHPRTGASAVLQVM